MAANQIPVSSSTPWGAQLLAYRAALVAYRAQQAALARQGAVILGKIAAMVNGSDYTLVEQQLSLQAGQGVTLFNQLNSVVGNFANTDSSAAVNAAIDQFDNWVG